MSVSKELLSFMEAGGFTMWPLFVLAMIMWFGLGYRHICLLRKSRQSLRELLQDNKLVYSTLDYLEQSVCQARAAINSCKNPTHIRSVVSEQLYPIRQESTKFAVLTNAIIITAPLLGLLGTVSGMIETFDSLADMAMFSQSGGIAGGISQALFSTQMGLIVAIPGLIFSRYLNRKQDILEEEMEQIIEYFIVESAQTP